MGEPHFKIRAGGVLQSDHCHSRAPGMDLMLLVQPKRRNDQDTGCYKALENKHDTPSIVLQDKAQGCKNISFLSQCTSPTAQSITSGSLLYVPHMHCQLKVVLRDVIRTQKGSLLLRNAGFPKRSSSLVIWGPSRNPGFEYCIQGGIACAAEDEHWHEPLACSWAVRLRRAIRMHSWHLRL